MEYAKFNKKIGSNYWQSFVSRDSNFYEKIGDVMCANLSSKEKLIGLDIGSGPGIGAWLCNQRNINVRLFGIEPSDNWKEGEVLAEELQKLNSKVEYSSKKGEMKDVKSVLKLKDESLDFILFLRAAHEIMLSYKNYNDFKKDFLECLRLLKKGGVVIIADPEYADYINKSPANYKNVIDEIRTYKEKSLGHSHIPSDYLTIDKIKELFHGFNIKENMILPNFKDLEYLKSKGFNLETPPTEFYITCLTKGN